MAEVAEGVIARAAMYGVLAAAAIWSWNRERRSGPRADLWPPYWLTTALLFLGMGFGRAVEIGDLVTQIGREQAAGAGWYEVRRPVQAAMVTLVAVVWLAMVVLAVLRVPERRRRYLPSSILALTLACYAAVRVVSLHHVDTVLYRWDVVGVRVGTVIEYLLGAITLAAIFGSWRGALPRPAASSRLGSPGRHRWPCSYRWSSDSRTAARRGAFSGKNMEL